MQVERWTEDKDLGRKRIEVDEKDNSSKRKGR